MPYPLKGNGRTGSVILIGIALIVVTLAVYWQTVNHQFLNFDDNVYVTANHHVATGITGRNIMWAFSSVEASNWHPLTWLSHMTDAQLFGMSPGGHHITSTIFHSLSTLLLFLLLLRLTGALWSSSFVAALFALHPLHVESVAWIAERKDVLSAFFWFLTLFLYSEYAAKRNKKLYLLALCSFILGLMAKPMLVTLPLILLLLDLWPLDRYRSGNIEPQFQQNFLTIAGGLIKEKIPFFACSLLSVFITIYAQNKGGSIAALSAIPFPLRCENAIVSYVTYIGKTFWPHNLAVYYPFPLAIPTWQVISSLLILLLLSAIALRTWKTRPYLTAGWFWFLVTLLPVIGLIQIGDQAMADRYSYIPVTGLFIIAAWGFRDLTINVPYRHSLSALIACSVLIISTAITWQQLGYWRDNYSLFRHTLSITTGNYKIHYNLGLALQSKGELTEAIHQYQEVLRTNPFHADTHNNLGLALQTKGDLNAAVQEFQTALRIDPGYKNAHVNLGAAFQANGMLDAAILEYGRALQISPNDADAHYNKGVALQAKGELDAASQEYREVIRTNPGHKNAHSNQGVVLAIKGDLPTAIREFQEALRISPYDTSVKNNLELALRQRNAQENGSKQ
jgi:tetratricopeptide (TPR) repeat protein